MLLEAGHLPRCVRCASGCGVAPHVSETNEPTKCFVAVCYAVRTTREAVEAFLPASKSVPFGDAERRRLEDRRRRTVPLSVEHLPREDFGRGDVIRKQARQQRKQRPC